MAVVVVRCDVICVTWMNACLNARQGSMTNQKMTERERFPLEDKEGQRGRNARRKCYEIQR
jgi:hypothetical protein